MLLATSGTKLPTPTSKSPHSLGTELQTGRILLTLLRKLTSITVEIISQSTVGSISSGSTTTDRNGTEQDASLHPPPNSSLTGLTGIHRNALVQAAAISKTYSLLASQLCRPCLMAKHSIPSVGISLNDFPLLDNFHSTRQIYKCLCSRWQ